MMQALRNLLGLSNPSFQPATRGDFEACCIAGVAERALKVEGRGEWDGVYVQRKSRDRENEGSTKQSGLFVAAMLAGRSMTIQQFVNLLHAHGYVSNHPGNRIGSGRRWLQARGVNVRWRWEKTKTGKKHKVWWVDKDELLLNGLAAKAAYNVKNKGREVR